MVSTHISCRTQTGAIRSATLAAKDEAKTTGVAGYAIVLLASGDTLTITATPNGKVRRKKSPGWVTCGALFCSRRVYDLI